MRKLEAVTLHFDLSHLSHLPPDQEFTLRALGARVVLKRHDEATRRYHAGRNRALAAMPEHHLQRITHFVTDVELPADELGFHWVGYPSTRPSAVMDEIATVFQHVPSPAVRRAVRAMRRDGRLQHPPILSHYGVTPDAVGADDEDLHVDGTNFRSFIDAALTIVMQHPEIGTFEPKDYYQISCLVTQEPTFTDLWQYMSTHSAENGDPPWYENTVVKDPSGAIMPPAPGLVGSDGKPVPWTKMTVDGQQTEVIGQFKLSDELADAATPVTQAVGTAVKQQPWLKGKHWKTQHGVTEIVRSSAAPTVGNRPLAAAAGVATMSSQGPASAATPTGEWTLTAVSPDFGLDLSSVNFDDEKKELTFSITNWPNRGLAAYVQYFDTTGQALNPPDSLEDFWAGFPDVVVKNVQRNKTKRYLKHIGAGNTCFGSPVPQWLNDAVPITVPVPDEASTVRILLGGLGNGYWDWDVDLAGLMYTCLCSYGMPALLSAMSVGVQSTKWFMDWWDDPDNFKLVIMVGTPVYLLMAGIGTVTLGPKDVLVMSAQFGGGILLSFLLGKLAAKITGYVTATELADNAPYVGWGLRIAGQTAAIADMVATSIEVGLSPATYTLDAKRSMTLKVTIMPDPTHPIWPEVSDHYVIRVRYKGVTTLTKVGPMPGRENAPIVETFSATTNDALPVAPGVVFTIEADIYSASNWLCGKWVSASIEAVPNDGDSRSESGSIVEQLVPLDATTKYSHLAKLNYDGVGKNYAWEKSYFSLDDGLEPCFKPGIAPPEVLQAFLSHGVRLSSGAKIDGDFSKQVTVTDPGSGTTYRVVKTAIMDGGKVVGSELQVRNTTEPAPAATANSLKTQDVQDLVGITINNQAYKAGYCYLAQRQTLPVDNGSDPQSTAMYVFRSISTLADPGAGMRVPARGFSVQAYIAYDQFGPPGLFSISPAEKYLPDLDKGGALPKDIADLFSSQNLALTGDAQVTVITASAAWQISVGGQPKYDLRRQVDVVAVFKYPTVPFSLNNFYLDTRAAQGVGLNRYYLRRVDLSDNAGDFDYDSGLSWGAFDLPNIDALAIHPDGYALAVNSDVNKLSIVQLSPAAVADKDAPLARPFLGTGDREGLVRGPCGMAIAADGRVLLLERSNRRVQAFDVQGKPVRCFASDLAFTADASLASDLNQRAASTGLLQALQKNVPVLDANPLAYDPRYLLNPVFSMPTSYATALNAGTVTADLRAQFAAHGLDLGDQISIVQTASGLWLLQDSSMTYDVRSNGEGLDPAHAEIDVYKCFSLTILVKAADSEWTIMDRMNSLSFDVKTKGETLQFQGLTSLLRLKNRQASQVTYLDLAVESKGFIYVLSYVNDGANPSDYRLDIYQPDGTPLNQADQDAGRVNAARIAVDQWRTLFALNYQQMQGPGGRPEPTVSQWVASAPAAE